MPNDLNREIKIYDFSSGMHIKDCKIQGAISRLATAERIDFSDCCLVKKEYPKCGLIGYTDNPEGIKRIIGE